MEDFCALWGLGKDTVGQATATAVDVGSCSTERSHDADRYGELGPGFAPAYVRNRVGLDQFTGRFVASHFQTSNESWKLALMWAPTLLRTPSTKRVMSAQRWGMGGQAKVIGSEDRLITHLIQFAALVGLRLLITGHSHPSGLKIFTQLTHKRQFGTRGKCTAAIVL